MEFFYIYRSTLSLFILQNKNKKIIKHKKKKLKLDVFKFKEKKRKKKSLKYNHCCNCSDVFICCLIAACTGCHGADFNKQAMGKSAVVKGWDAAKIETSLKGYKDGTLRWSYECGYEWSS